METFLRKYNWAIFLGLIGLGALLSALIANNFLASKLAPYTVPELPNLVAQKTEPSSGGAVNRADWSGMIGGRCLFGCVAPAAPLECPQGCADGEECQNGICVSTGEEEYEEVSDVPVQSDLNVKLLGSMVATQPRWSLALLFDNTTQQTHVLRPGEMLLGQAEILEISRDRVIFRRSGRLEFIRMENTLAGNPVAAPVRQGQSRASRNPTSQVDGNAQRANPDAIKAAAAAHEEERSKPAANEGGVQQVSENRYSVPRAAIEQQMSNPEALARQARIMPNYKDGESAGLRLVGVSPNSVYSQLGIRSGDVIHSVNGVPLDNQRKAMEMLDKMRSESRVTIEVERRGKKEKIEYDIR